MSFLEGLLGAIATPAIRGLCFGRLPVTNGSLEVQGVNRPVEVIRDRWGVPHIYAENEPDLFFAQGYVQAQDRLFQMELNRRTAQGKLSELFGKIALDTDRLARTFGFGRLGKQDLANLSDQERMILEAYTRGVNAFLTNPATRLPVEFTLINHTPEPWQFEDTLAFMRLMMWKLSHAWYGEIVRAEVAQAVGPKNAAELEIHYPPENTASLPMRIEFNRLESDGVLVSARGPFLEQGLGSNAWVIAGSRSKTGTPYLCNDMHLQLGLPALWYEMHLSAGSFQVSGVTLPGMPLILVGHNARIAWGMTLAFTDCEDLFVEKFDPENPAHYLFQGEWQEAESIPSAIVVKGQSEPTIEHVLVTRHGPVISGVVPAEGAANISLTGPAQAAAGSSFSTEPTALSGGDGRKTNPRLAVQSMALQAENAFPGFTLLNKAGSWDDFVRAMARIPAPQLNVTYADVDGNIGYWVTGAVPLRACGDGATPAPGWTADYEWVGTVPFEEMPHALNPQRGFLVTCNHRIIPDGYPHFLGNVWMNGYRARRLEEYIDAREKLGTDDMRQMQLDLTCLPGKELVEQLRDFQPDDSRLRPALERLLQWDGVLGAGSTGGAIYEVFRYTLLRNVLEPSLGTGLTNQVMGDGFNPVLYDAQEWYGHDTTALLRMLKDPNSWWVQTAGGRRALLQHSLKMSVDWLEAKLGADMDGWQWGKLHQVILAHPLGLQKPLDRVFNRGPFPIGGDTDTPCQTAIKASQPYGVEAWAPSFRQIIDMGDLSKSLVIYPGGQSGHVSSPHYDDLFQPWLRGEYHPMLWTREQVEEAAEGTLWLRGKG